MTIKEQVLAQGATKRQLIAMYKTTYSTWDKWLAPFKIEPHPNTYRYTPGQVLEIFKAIGEPADQ